MTSMPPPLIADHRAIDFANTLAHPGGVATEWLADGAALVEWVAAAGLDDPDGAAVVAAASTADLDAAARQARDLRRWLVRLLDVHAGTDARPLTKAALRPLNAVLATDDGYRQVDPAPAWHRRRRPSTAVAALLLPVADAIGDLLTNEDLSLVGRCGGGGCTLRFLDRTKSHGRRWCDMATCGNRAKAAAHRARHARRP